MFFEAKYKDIIKKIVFPYDHLVSVTLTSLKICVSAILISFSKYELKALEINVKKIIAVKDTWLMQLRKESLNFFSGHFSCSEKSYSIRRVN